MNREIKFRAWANHTKAMITWKEFLNDMASFIFALKHKDTFHIMQYTGLKDKNEKEIYEGDIVKHKYYGKCEVVWSGGWSIKHIRGGENRTGKQRMPYRDKTFEIIGNIYENPDLLK